MNQDPRGPAGAGPPGGAVNMPAAGGQQIPITPEELFIMIGMKEAEIIKMQQAISRANQERAQMQETIRQLQQKLAGQSAPGEKDAPEKEEKKEKEAEEKGAPTEAIKKVPKIKKIEKKG